MLDTGIRLSELSGLELEDVDLNEGYMVVRGKGRKERYVPFGKSIRKLLWSYMKQRSKYSKEGVFSLFITQTGTSLSRGGVGMIFKRLKKKLNLPGRFHPHLLRHSFAVNYINNGGDSFSLQIKITLMCRRRSTCHGRMFPSWGIRDSTNLRLWMCWVIV